MTCSDCGICLARALNERANLGAVFLSWLAFDSGGNVYPPRLQNVYGFSDIFGIQATRNNQIEILTDQCRHGGGSIPVKSPARSAGLIKASRIQENSADL